MPLAFAAHAAVPRRECCCWRWLAEPESPAEPPAARQVVPPKLTSGRPK